MHAHDAARGTLASEHDGVELAAQRQERAVRERHRLRNGDEALAHPLEIAIEEGARFSEIALDGKRDDDCTSRAADAQRQTARAGGYGS